MPRSLVGRRIVSSDLQTTSHRMPCPTVKTTHHQGSHRTSTVRRITAAASDPGTTTLKVTEDTATDQPETEATLVTVADDGTDSIESSEPEVLRALISNLENRGETYTPGYLTQEAFEAIVSSPMERGNA